MHEGKTKIAYFAFTVPLTKSILSMMYGAVVTLRSNLGSPVMVKNALMVFKTVIYVTGCPALFSIKLGLILGTKIRIFRANLGLKLGIL